MNARIVDLFLSRYFTSNGLELLIAGLVIVYILLLLKGRVLLRGYLGETILFLLKVCLILSIAVIVGTVCRSYGVSRMIYVPLTCLLVVPSFISPRNKKTE